MLCEVHHNRSNEGADIHPVRKKSNHDTTQMGGRYLRGIHVGKGDEKPISEAKKQAAEIQNTGGVRANLDSACNCVENASSPETFATAEESCKVPSGER